MVFVDGDIFFTELNAWWYTTNWMAAQVAGKGTKGWIKVWNPRQKILNDWCGSTAGSSIWSIAPMYLAIIQKLKLLNWSVTRHLGTSSIEWNCLWWRPLLFSYEWQNDHVEGLRPNLSPVSTKICRAIWANMMKLKPWQWKEAVTQSITRWCGQRTWDQVHHAQQRQSIHRNHQSLW
jgi:hypothetical protein